jgi:phosphate transport system substrate-binding protein
VGCFLRLAWIIGTEHKNTESWMKRVETEREPCGKFGSPESKESCGLRSCGTGAQVARAWPAVMGNRTSANESLLWIVLANVLALSVLLMAAITAFFLRGRFLVPPEHVVLSLQGSTSLGDELVPKLAEAFLRDELGAKTTGYNVEEKDTNGRRHLHVWGRVPGVQALQVIEIYAAGSSSAFKCLAAENGRDYCDIGMSSRPINDMDRRRYPKVGHLGNPTTEHVVALDGIAVIVNSRNPVSQLSIPQVRAIYEGEIRNWKEVGGDDAAIELLGRDRNSGTFEVFTEKLMRKDTQASERLVIIPPERQFEDSGLIVDAVIHSPNAIGYVSAPLAKDAKALHISDGSGSALGPTELAVVTEEYPICRRLLLYDWGAPGSLVDAFIRYVTSEPGQAVVTQTPFVDLTPSVFPVVPSLKTPLAYKKITSGYSRIGLSFHFSRAQDAADKERESRPDILARINVLRLRTFLEQHGGNGDDILLVAFADKVEGHIPSEHLVRRRAEIVATELRAIGIIVPSENVRDLGNALPVASSDNPEGRSKNCRVEVWVRNGLL